MAANPGVKQFGDFVPKNNLDHKMWASAVRAHILVPKKICSNEGQSRRFFIADRVVNQVVQLA